MFMDTKDAPILQMKCAETWVFVRYLSCFPGRQILLLCKVSTHDGVINTWWRHQMKKMPHYCPFMRGIHRSPVKSPHKGQWRGTLMFSLTCAWTKGWVNTRDAGDLKRHRTHYYVPVMSVMQTVRSGAAGQRWLWLQRTFVPILTRFYNGNSYIDDTFDLFSTSMQVWTKPFTEDISKCMKEVFTFRSDFIKSEMVQAMALQWTDEPNRLIYAYMHHLASIS